MSEIVNPGIKMLGFLYADNISGAVLKVVYFTTQVAGGVPPYSFNWDFGDETGSNNPAPVHLYSHHNTYNVALIVTDSANNSIKTGAYVRVAETKGAAPGLAAYSDIMEARETITINNG